MFIEATPDGSDYILIINTDNIVSLEFDGIGAAISMVNGITFNVKETPSEVLGLIKSGGA